MRAYSSATNFHVYILWYKHCFPPIRARVICGLFYKPLHPSCSYVEAMQLLSVVNKNTLLLLLLLLLLLRGMQIRTEMKTPCTLQQNKVGNSMWPNSNYYLHVNCAKNILFNTGNEGRKETRINPTLVRMGEQLKHWVFWTLVYNWREY